MMLSLKNATLARELFVVSAEDGRLTKRELMIAPAASLKGKTMTAREQIAPAVIRPWPRYASAKTLGEYFDRSATWARQRFGDTEAWMPSIKRFDLVKVNEIMAEERKDAAERSSLADLL